ncbi:MAG: 16S rRNA (guanine(527)-N(7))-methyltransferase RsmG [Eubacterium sp.]|nr:16S rRNA (guanine(527)-N(7))-methyltransferase RsmG [Eubacterium sp.]
MVNRELLRQYAAEIGVELDDNALSRFLVYEGELVGTNRKYNLTAITDSDEVLVKHFIDSLMLLKYFDLDYGMDVIDVGSGAGFPGLPLLIAKNNKLNIVFLDSTRKKTRFIEHALASCGLEAPVVCERAEECAHDPEFRETFDVATARAVAPLNILAEYCLPYVKVGGYFIALKGSKDEVPDALCAIGELGGELESNVSYKLPNGDPRSIVIIKKVSQTSTKYPRVNSKIAKSPL